ncbi:MAG: class I SAM-dependent methyltransferase [Deltaproteobacteria bacterium]|nr:class I SAM-dependent methyltransferase [Deltaproteobacteria bacterium]
MSKVMKDGPKGPSARGGEHHWLQRWQAVRQPWWFDPYFAPLIAEALPHLAPCLESGGDLLHVGSGIGDKTDALRELGARAVGLELSPDLVARARDTYPTTRFVEGNALAMPFEDGTFDAVFSFSVMQCLDWRQMLTEVRRVLRPGGRAVFIENLAGSPFAQAYRLGKRLLRSPYRTHQRPLRHLAWEECPELLQVFPTVEYRAFHLFTPALLAPPVLARVFGGGEQIAVGGGPSFTSLTRLDTELLRRFPSLSDRAWKVVVRVTSSSTGRPEQDVVLGRRTSL